MWMISVSFPVVSAAMVSFLAGVLLTVCVCVLRLTHMSRVAVTLLCDVVVLREAATCYHMSSSCSALKKTKSERLRTLRVCKFCMRSTERRG